MADLFRVTVVAESDEPVTELEVEALLEHLSAAMAAEAPAQPADDPVTLRSDRQGLDVVLLVEADSADDARERVERAALTAVAVQVADAEGGTGAAQGLRVEMVRAEPAFLP